MPRRDQAARRLGRHEEIGVALRASSSNLGGRIDYTGAMGSLRAAARDRDWQGVAALTLAENLRRARGAPPRGANKATANQSPCKALSSKSPIPKERLRVSNWIVQGLYDYAVSKTVEL